MKRISENNRGVVMLFAVILASIILAMSIGITSIAQKEVQFGTSAKDTDNAFFAADSGAECALYNDKTILSKFPIAGPATAITCGGSSITPTFAGGGSNGAYAFKLTGLGASSQACAVITVTKNSSSGTTTTVIDSKGYNIGDSSCVSSSISRVERELKVTYGGSSGPAYDPATYTYCADENGTCTFTGVGTVAYGDAASGFFNYQTNVNGSIACNNTTFGDPIVGTAKKCYYHIP